MRRSKRYREAEKKREFEKEYTLAEAVELIAKMPRVKFDETIEVSCKLGVDPAQSEQMVRGSLVLPHGTGKTVRVLVFCEPDKESEAKDAGADHIGTKDVAEKILKEGWMEFDCCISTPGMMREVSKLGKVLGPRGLMPSPKTGSVTPNVAHAVKEAKRGKVDFRMDKFAGVHIGLGKLSFKKEALIENVRAFLDALIAARPAAAKGDYLKYVYLSSTMSPSVKVVL